MTSETTQNNIAWRDAIEEAIRSYLDTYPTAVQELTKFLEYRRENETPQVLIPMEELETKLEMINNIIKVQRFRRDEDWMLNKIQFSYLIRMRASDLRDLSTIGWLAELTLNAHGQATRQFLQKGRFVPTTTAGKGKANDNESLTNQSGTSLKRGVVEMNPIGRNRETIKGCLELDKHTCVITGLGKPTVAHIIPFAWNSTDDNRAATETLKHALWYMSCDPRADSPEERFKKFYETKGVSDKTWNVISLCHDLHSLWGYGIWALKWRGSIELEDNPSRSRITLQFHWMPRNIKMDDSNYSPLQTLVPEEITVDGVNALRDELKHSYGGEQHSCPDGNCKTCLEVAKIGARDCRSGQPIKTGDIFTIIRPTEDVDKCKEAFDLQWAIINAAAISGCDLILNDDYESDGKIEPPPAERGDPDEIEFDLETDYQYRIEDWVMGEDQD
ncbi:hypothetical protein FPOA_11620 [Fusarium poae]|uniref:HNH nuclease domain-containing protein n=1 Tax=Fusarium poae TaxID=36050 RepID=A0A1B8AHB6_FUSPO|nr:hypothetical protein FPOA_11620 [Fusarium poae]